VQQQISAMHNGLIGADSIVPQIETMSVNEKESTAFWIHHNPSIVESPKFVPKMLIESTKQGDPSTDTPIDEEITVECPHCTEWCPFPDMVDHKHIL